jgi:hypothetical protein
LFFPIFFSKFFFHLYICACLFSSWLLLQVSCDIDFLDFYFLCTSHRHLFWHVLCSSPTT